MMIGGNDTVVKVQRHDKNPSLFLVYDREGLHVVEQNIPVRAAKAMGTETMTYFRAMFRNGLWEIGRRAPDQLW